MTTSTSLARVQVASALFDYFVAGIFAFPIVATIHLGVNLRFVHEWLGALGSFPGFEPFHLLFVNMFGGFAIMWSTLRIIRRDEALLALCDALLRYYFALLMLIYVVLWQAPAMLYAFVASELIWGTALVWVVIARGRVG